MVGQLLRAVPSMRAELIRSLHKKKVSLIVDSGSLGSVVSSHLLRGLEIKVERMGQKKIVTPVEF